ncbi:MAG: PadR family transcriptional regulator [Clostridia bacterium]|nr:PadR family transcriptional regulator [Clostridia bacterium]
MDVQLRRGLIEICVLAAMLRQPTYGYKLIRDVSPYMEISESTLYPILKRLEASECLTVSSAEHNGRLRKYYSITPNGRARIEEFLSDWQSIMRTYAFIEREAANV